MKYYGTNNDRKMHRLPLWRKKNKKKRFYTRCSAEEVIGAFLFCCES